MTCDDGTVFRLAGAHNESMRCRLASFVVTSLLIACSSDSTTTPGVPGSGDGGGADSSSSAPPLGQDQHGDGTYYGATGAGACSFDATPSDLDVAAMNAPQYAGSAVCGECVAITGPKGGVTVRIVDLCPECKSGDLDLSQEAFAKIADVSAGRVKITWRVVLDAMVVSGASQFK